MRKGSYIIVFINEKLVILSAPKTRTTSLLAALEPHASIMFRDPPGVKNINLAEYQRQIYKMLENLSDGPFENFGIVRHPLDRMSSWYRYRQRDQLKGHRNSTHGMHTGNAGEKERKNCDVNPDPLPMPHDVNAYTDKTNPIKPAAIRAMPSQFGAYLIGSSEEEQSIPKPNFFRSADQNRKHQLVKENLRDDRQFIELTHFIAVSGLMQKNRRPVRMEPIGFVFQPAIWGFGL